MEYLLILLSILMINILLSGDNALVIALASRNLSPQYRRTAALLGSAGAVGLRIILSFAAVYLLKIPYLQIAGGLLLLWIAVKLVADKHEPSAGIKAKSTLGGAVQTIILADLIMSLDNVVAIAGAAKGNISLIIIGITISVPIIIWGSSLISLLMRKWPVIIIVGAAILGWTAGEMVLGDKAVHAVIGYYPLAVWIIPAGFAVVIYILGMRYRNRI